MSFTAACVNPRDRKLRGSLIFGVSIDDDSFLLEEHYDSKFSNIVKKSPTSVTIKSPEDVIFYNSDENKLER